jgi:hypothetical protein
MKGACLTGEIPHRSVTEFAQLGEEYHGVIKSTKSLEAALRQISGYGFGGKPMSKFHGNWTMAAIALLVGCLMSVHAAQGPAAFEVKSFTGQLVKVDVQMKTIDVRGSDGKDIEFLYTDKTEIVGNPVEQGIAGTIGTRVKVDYTEKSGIRTASKIQVIPREAAL